MADDDAGWQRVGNAIARRISELSLTQAEVAAAGGPSHKTLKGYIEGRPIVRKDKRRELCRVLGWRVESIDLILQGGGPVPADNDAVRRALTRVSPRVDESPIHIAASGVDLHELQERDPEAYDQIMELARIALDRARERGRG